MIFTIHQMAPRSVMQEGDIEGTGLV